MRTIVRAVCLTLALGAACKAGMGTGDPPPMDSGMNVDTGLPGTDTGPRTDAPAGDGGGNCASATTCGPCAAMGPCGWCHRTGRCLAGGGMGSTDGTCTGADWDFLGSRCATDGAPPTPVDASAQCAMATACGPCAAMGPCGWCLRTNRCLQGNSMGSTDGTCTGADFTFTSSGCPLADGGMACRTGIPRNCNLTLAGGVRTCTAGSRVNVGCHQGCSPPLGSCTGDAVMQICRGSDQAAPCAMPIAFNDDAPEPGETDGGIACAPGGGDGGTSAGLCPALTFTCPADGMYTVWTGPYGSGMATCTVAVR